MSDASIDTTVAQPRQSASAKQRYLSAPDEFLDEEQKARVAAIYVAYTVLSSTGFASTTGAPVDGLIQVAEYVVNGSPIFQLDSSDMLDPGDSVIETGGTHADEVRRAMGYGGDQR